MVPWENNGVSGWAGKRTLAVLKIGIGLLAVACGVALLASGVEHVRDSADRAH
jgi:hypothetical protein